MCFCLVLSVLVAGDKDVSRSGIYTTSNEYNVPAGVTGISGRQILLLFLFCFVFVTGCLFILIETSEVYR